MSKDAALTNYNGRTQYTAKMNISRADLLMVTFAMTTPFSEWGGHDYLKHKTRGEEIWDGGAQFINDAEIDFIVKAPHEDEDTAWAEAILYMVDEDGREDGRGRPVDLDEVYREEFFYMPKGDIVLEHEEGIYVATLHIDNEVEDALKISTLRSVRALGSLERQQEAFLALERMSKMGFLMSSEVARLSPEEALHTVLGLVQEAAPMLAAFRDVCSLLGGKDALAHVADRIKSAKELVTGLEQLRRDELPTQSHIDARVAFGEELAKDHVTWQAKMLVLCNLGLYHDGASWIDEDINTIIEGIMQSEADILRDEMDALAESMTPDHAQLALARLTTPAFDAADERD